MTLRYISIISLSVFLSAGVNVWFHYRWKQEFARAVQTNRIELIDDQHRVRGTIGIVRLAGQEEPEIDLLDSDGNRSVHLALNERGEGTLWFNSKDKEGKVGVGYLWGSDTPEPRAEDPLGSWGLRILGPGLQTVGLGIGIDGKVFSPAR